MDEVGEFPLALSKIFIKARKSAQYIPRSTVSCEVIMAEKQRDHQRYHIENFVQTKDEFS